MRQLLHAEWQGFTISKVGRKLYQWKYAAKAHLNGFVACTLVPRYLKTPESWMLFTQWKNVIMCFIVFIPPETWTPQISEHEHNFSAPPGITPPVVEHSRKNGYPCRSWRIMGKWHHHRKWRRPWRPQWWWTAKRRQGEIFFMRLWKWRRNSFHEAVETKWWTVLMPHPTCKKRPIANWCFKCQQLNRCRFWNLGLVVVRQSSDSW